MRGVATYARSRPTTTYGGRGGDAHRHPHGGCPHRDPARGAPVTAPAVGRPALRSVPTGTAVPRTGPPPDLATTLRVAGGRLLAAVVDRLAQAALEKVDDLAAGLERIASEGGPGVGAAVGAGRAYAEGRNVLWGAIKGGFAALGTAAKVLIGVVLVLAPVLLVLSLVVLIVAALVWAVVAAVRAIAG